MNLAVYDSKVRPSLQQGAPTRTYIKKRMSSHLLLREKALEATEIWKIAANKTGRSLILAQSAQSAQFCFLKDDLN